MHQHRRRQRRQPEQEEWIQERHLFGNVNREPSTVTGKSREP
jgi:hypothetical protein